MNFFIFDSAAAEKLWLGDRGNQLSLGRSLIVNHSCSSLVWLPGLLCSADRLAKVVMRP